MTELKDNIANTTTLMGSGGFLMGWNEGLTLLLILTGILLNVVRIVEIKTRDKKNKNE